MNDSFYERLAEYSQVVASILFIIVLVYLWRRFVAPAVLASQERKNAELADAERRRDATRAETEVGQGEIASAETDARAIRVRAETDAKRLRERILAEANSEGERLVRNADGELERARTAARDGLRVDLLEKAMQIAREASTHLDDTENRRLVGEAVDIAERSNT